MGGNRFKRKEYTDDQIVRLFEIYKNNNDKLNSLFSNKRKENIRLWLYDLAINMSRESKAKLQHLINEYNNNVPSCLGCKSLLQLQEFNEVSNSYKKYCLQCRDKHIWATSELLSQFTLISRGKKISQKKKEFYATEEGKKISKNVGKINSKKMKDFHLTDAGRFNREKNAIIASTVMKQKIANGEFTPNITNSRTRWEAKINLNNQIIKFRSSWEACFWLCNQHLSYETFRLSYFDKGTTRTYIADFFDYKSKTLYEIKPTSQWLKVNYKMQQVINFCNTNNIKFLWINEKNILKYIDISKFDNYNILQYNKLIKGIK